MSERKSISRGQTSSRRTGGSKNITPRPKTSRVSRPQSKPADAIKRPVSAQKKQLPTRPVQNSQPRKRGTSTYPETRVHTPALVATTSARPVTIDSRGGVRRKTPVQNTKLVIPPNTISPKQTTVVYIPPETETCVVTEKPVPFPGPSRSLNLQPRSPHKKRFTMESDEFNQFIAQTFRDVLNDKYTDDFFKPNNLETIEEINLNRRSERRELLPLTLEEMEKFVELKEHEDFEREMKEGYERRRREKQDKAADEAIKREVMHMIATGRVPSPPKFPEVLRRTNPQKTINDMLFDNKTTPSPPRLDICDPSNPCSYRYRCGPDEAHVDHEFFAEVDYDYYHGRRLPEDHEVDYVLEDEPDIRRYFDPYKFDEFIKDIDDWNQNTRKFQDNEASDCREQTTKKSNSHVSHLPSIPSEQPINTQHYNGPTTLKPEEKI